MSTKIYDAYRLPEHVSLANVMAWVHSHREPVRQLLAREWERDICQGACDELDRMIVVAAGMANPRERDTQPGERDLIGSTAFRLEVKYAQRNKEGGRTPGLDTQVKMIVFPHGDRCLAKLVCDSRPVTEYFRELEGMEDFSYWNNVDEPKGMSQEDWDNRGKLWNALIPSGRYEVDGMVLNISMEGDVPGIRIRDPGAVAKYLPALERRAIHAAHCSPVSAEIFQREGQAMSSIIHMDRGEYPEFNAVRDTIAGLLPDTDLAARMVLMTGAERKAAIDDIVMRFNTPAGHPNRPAPRV